MTRSFRGMIFSALTLLLVSCSVTPASVFNEGCDDKSPGAAQIAAPLAAGLDKPAPATRASAAFTKHWSDGKAELSGYKVTTNRYGKLREGTAVLIYVTEPMNSRSWIKDDDAPADRRVQVIKLNHALKFRTGLYPYSVMTSVFSPVDGQGRERFAPAKISFSAQEWCGHVYHHIFPKGDRFHGFMHSYFASEGDRSETTRTVAGTLYEDALLIQLRELDGPFAGGGDWSGKLVPALWTARKAHRPLAPVKATIRRSAARRASVEVTRFTLKYGELTRTIDVERAAPRRVLGWTSSDGEQATLLKTARMAYWKLSGPGGEAYLKDLGL